jgi:hypothetical protein
MPTYNQAAFVRRALESLHAQTLRDWELVIVDDGSTDDTPQRIAPYLRDGRVRHQRLERNVGLGAALNVGLGLARAPLVTYLPSDDVLYPEHLQSLVECAEAHPEAPYVFSGVRHSYNRTAPGAIEGRPLQLVQVLHRRSDARWIERDELVTDDLDRMLWAKLREAGEPIGTGRISCEWVAHPEQRYRIITGDDGGVSRYRRFYGVGPGVPLNFQPSRGVAVDERERYARFASPMRRQPGLESEPLKILLVGELGFNPERVLALEERGHRLYGTWVERPESWDAAGPLPFGNLEDVPFDRRWAERVRAIAPDVIYALLNWQAVELIDAVLGADLDIPLVFHFKEGPFICQERGLWPALMRVLERSDGQIFINEECREWFRLATDGALGSETTLILDGDLPKADWMGDGWPAKLSARDGEVHTVCAGRPLGLDPFEAIAAAGIHVHFYGSHFQQRFPNWVRAGLATGRMHLHPTVEPADWVRELGQYDAAWFHVFDSDNGGDLRRARWDDLNLPARLGTYAAAGLPWIIKDTAPARVALQRIAAEHDVGVLFRDFAHLGELLRDRERIAQQTANMRAARRLFAFDTHADALVAFFRRIIARHRAAYATP